MLHFYLNLLTTEEERSKFEQLYLKYKALMHYVAKKVLHDDYLAEDAVHEAFIRVAKNIDKISQVSCPQTKNYLVIIVRNISLDMIKKGEKEMSVDKDILDCYPVQDEDLEETVIRKSEVSKIITQIEKLSDTYKDALYMNVVENMSIKEIANVLDRKEDTVKKQIQRAKSIIIKALESEANR